MYYLNEERKIHFFFQLESRKGRGEKKGLFVKSELQNKACYG